MLSPIRRNRREEPEHSGRCLETVGEVDVGAFERSVAADVFWSSYKRLQRKGAGAGRRAARAIRPERPSPVHAWYQSASEPSVDHQLQHQAERELASLHLYVPSRAGLLPVWLRPPQATRASQSPNLRLDSTRLDANDKLRVSVDVTNKGSVPGTALVQLYVKSPVEAPSLQCPLKRLEGFRQVWLATGQTKSVTLTVNVPDLRSNSRSLLHA